MPKAVWIATIIASQLLPATINAENQEHADHCGALNSQPAVSTLPAISHRDGTGARAATLQNGASKSVADGIPNRAEVS
jgi:hypothetical protein